MIKPFDHLEVVTYFRTNLKASGLSANSQEKHELIDLLEKTDYSKPLPASSTVIDIKSYSYYRSELGPWFNVADPLRNAIVRLIPKKLVKTYDAMISLTPSIFSFKDQENVFFGLTMVVSKEIAERNGFLDQAEMVNYRQEVAKLFRKVREILQILIEQESGRHGGLSIDDALILAGREHNEFTINEIRVANILRHAIAKKDRPVSTEVYVPIDTDEFRGTKHGTLPENSISLQWSEQESEPDEEDGESSKDFTTSISGMTYSKSGVITHKQSTDDKKFQTSTCTSGYDVILDYLGRLGADANVLLREKETVSYGRKLNDRHIKAIAIIPEPSLAILQDQQKKIAALDFTTSNAAIASLFEMFRMESPKASLEIDE